MTRGATVLPSMDGTFTRSYSEPCEFSLTIDNEDGTYDQDSDLADVRNASPTYLNLRITTGVTTWVSPDIRVKTYRSGPDETVVVSGRCRLCELDVNDQVIDAGGGISTVEGETAANIVDMIITPYGLTATGVPSRVIPTFDLVGNPLNMLQDLLPDYVFYMGTGSQIVFSPYTTHGSGPHLEDAEHLEIVDFVRSDDIYNRATVERVVPQSGEVVLLDVQQSWEQHPEPSVLPYNLEQPSRQMFFRIMKAYRGTDLLAELVLKDENGDPIGPSPYTMPSYTGTTPVHSITVDYTLRTTAAANGPFKSNIEILITGYPLDVDPVPIEGYSATATEGTGDKPYPEAFSYAVIPDLTAAQSVADAKVEQGMRDGSLLGLTTRILADKIPTPNGALTVTDFKKSLSSKAVICESFTLSWSESGDTGTMDVETTFVEA